MVWSFSCWLYLKEGVRTGNIRRNYFYNIMESNIKLNNNNIIGYHKGEMLMSSACRSATSWKEDTDCPWDDALAWNKLSSSHQRDNSVGSRHYIVDIYYQIYHWLPIFTISIMAIIHSWRAPIESDCILVCYGSSIPFSPKIESIAFIFSGVNYFALKFSHLDLNSTKLYLILVNFLYCSVVSLIS